MTFLWANMLWLLVAIPLAVAAYFLILRRKSKTAARYGAFGLVKQAMGGATGFRRHVPAALFLAAMTAMILAIARPAAFVTLPSDRGTVILAMDVSGSMRATDVEPDRLAAAQAAARQFIEEQPRNVRIGVVTFAGGASIVQAPTLNKDDALAALERFHLQRATAVGSGILTSLSALFPNVTFDMGPAYQDPSGQLGPFGGGPGGFGNGTSGGALPLGQQSPAQQAAPAPVAPGSDASAVIILLTDGQTNTGPDPVDAAQRAADMGVRVYTVGIGTTGGKIVGFGGRFMRVQLDEDSLKRIAEITHAKYFRADSAANLKDIYHSLSTQFVMEKTKSEITALFAAGGALLALVSVVLSMLWFSRIG